MKTGIKQIKKRAGQNLPSTLPSASHFRNRSFHLCSPVTSHLGDQGTGSPGTRAAAWACERKIKHTGPQPFFVVLRDLLLCDPPPPLPPRCTTPCPGASPRQLCHVILKALTNRHPDALTGSFHYNNKRIKDAR